MLFHFTMNMPSRNGNSVHQVIGGVDVHSLDELLDMMAKSDFIIVNEFYVESDQRGGARAYSDKGPIALNPLFIGKIKETRE